MIPRDRFGHPIVEIPKADAGSHPLRHFNARITIKGTHVVLNCLEGECPWCVEFDGECPRDLARAGRVSIADHRQIHHRGTNRFPAPTRIDLVVAPPEPKADHA